MEFSQPWSALPRVLLLRICSMGISSVFDGFDGGPGRSLTVPFLLAPVSACSGALKNG